MPLGTCVLCGGARYGYMEGTLRSGSEWASASASTSSNSSSGGRSSDSNGDDGEGQHLGQYGRQCFLIELELVPLLIDLDDLFAAKWRQKGGQRRGRCHADMICLARPTRL
jgi:hypothetical protein